MKFTTLLAGLLIAVTQVQAASVIAHFMLINTNNYTLSEFEDDFKLAKDAHIDAFALNMGWNEPHTPAALRDAFAAAANVGFKLMFSFDYMGGSEGDMGKRWPKESVVAMADEYFARDEYLKYGGKPVASTFEGTESADDWNDIKASTGCFFIPDWSSVSPETALGLGGGVADGLFSWNAWPVGDSNMNTESDDAFISALKGKPYMMPVSPWFYTNLPGYQKNWVWRGDDLWYDRWAQVLDKKPEFVQIISWNDYGESHHIGPVRTNALEAFDVGKAPFNYALGHPHDGWRRFLPYLVDTYKGAVAAPIAEEGLTVWYRSSPALACADGGTTANSASQSQRTLAPAQVVQDKIFFSALLTSDADVVVSVGGKTQSGNWTDVPRGGKGVYHGSVPFVGGGGGSGGDVVVKMIKYGTEIARIDGKKIVTECADGMTNWNAWVGGVKALHVEDPNPKPTPTGGEGPKVTANGDKDSAATALVSKQNSLVCIFVAIACLAIVGVV